MSQLTTKPETSDIRAVISGPNMKKRFADVLPKHLSVERFIRVALAATSRTPKLIDCTQESLLRCLIDLSAFGLEPDGRRAHLVPYGNTCTLIIDWKGLAELAMRSGIIAKLHADIVCQNDTFVYNLGEIIEHKIDWQKPRGDMYAAYAMAVTKDGPVFVAVLTKDEIDSIRKRSKSGNNGPWVSDYNEMAKKTAFRRLSKWLPLSAEFRDAIEKDNEDTEPRDVTPPKAEASPLFQSVPKKENTPLVLHSEEVSTREIFLAKIQALGEPWEKVGEVLFHNGILNDPRATAADCEDGEMAFALSAWPQLEKMMKGGALK